MSSKKKGSKEPKAKTDESSPTTTTTTTPKTESGDVKMYTREEVSKHNTDDDVWLILHGKVYNVTKFLEDHPGGPDSLQQNAGTDATDAFENLFHSDKARALLKGFYIGNVVGYTGADDAVDKPAGAKPTGGGEGEKGPLDLLLYLIPILIVILALYYQLFWS